MLAVLAVPRGALQLTCLAPHCLAHAAVGEQRTQQPACPVRGDELVDLALAGERGRGRTRQRLACGAQHLSVRGEARGRRGRVAVRAPRRIGRAG